MITLLPTTAPDQPSPAVQSVLALIALVTDPKATKERLDEIQAASSAFAADKAAAEAARQNGADALAEAQRVADKAIADSADAVAKVAAARDAAKDDRAKADTLNRAAAAKLDVVKTLEAQNADAAAALSKREADVSSRETAIGARETAAAARKGEADALVAEYTNKLLALKRLTS